MFLVLHGAASVSGSMRGEWGLGVALCVLFAAWIVQRTLHGEGLGELGLRVGDPRGLISACALGFLMLAGAAAYLRATGANASFYPDAALLGVGVLAQGGFAEELLFRGYLYGRLRRTRTFWRAATVSAAPFAAAHIFTFFTMEPLVALAALLLSIALSFPYARLYELGGRTIWAPSLLHAATQGGAKLLVVDSPSFPVVWMGLALAAAMCVFLIPVSRRE